MYLFFLAASLQFNFRSTFPSFHFVEVFFFCFLFFFVCLLFSNRYCLLLDSRFCSLVVGMHNAAVSKWELTKFSYSSFGAGFSDISWSASNLFLSVNIYLSLIFLLLYGKNRSIRLLLFEPHSFVISVVSSFRKRNMPLNSVRYYSISY